MIHSILYQNFQIHEKRAIELDPVCTTFVGDSDTGKSALIRGLIWVCLNQPLGDSFRTWDTDLTKVSMDVDDHLIVRKKGKGVNAYVLDGKPYPDSGITVPQDIATILNVGSVNFQEQIDPYYWFTLTPGDTSKELNQIVNLSLIDTTLTNLASELRSARDRAKTCNSRLTEVRKQKEELSWVPEVHTDLLELERLEEVLIEATRNTAELFSLVVEAEVHENTVQVLGEAKDDLKEIEAIAAQGVDCLWIIDSTQSLIRKASQLEKFKKEPLPDLTELDKLRKKRDTLEVTINDLQATIGRAVQQERDVEWLKKLLGKTAQELENKSEGRCPICGAGISRR